AEYPMARPRKLFAATFKSTWTAWLSQPSGHVTEMFADGKFGQLTAMLAVTAVVISARGAPGGEFEMSLHSRDVPSFCRVFAPARAAASPAFWRCRRVTSMLAPSSR